jgi:hypothetical protein
MPDLDITQYDVRPDLGLGRHMVLDERTLAYRRRYTGDPLHPIEWAPKVPVLNQQQLLEQGIHTSRLFDGVDDVDALGSCTANAATALASVLHTADTLAQYGLNTADAVAAEMWAIGLYADATTKDQWHDSQWPATDCGSSGLGVAKALKDHGLIDQYGTATTAEELCALLQTGPVLMGIVWLDAFFTPDPDGFIDSTPGWSTSAMAGGHEVCLTALEDVAMNADGTVADSTVLRFVNSWSTSWGDEGSGRLTVGTYRALRDQIDLIQPRLDAR